VTALYDGDDMAAEAERIAREYARQQARLEEIRRRSLELVHAVDEDMVSGHIAHGAGMHGAMQAAIDRAAARIQAVNDIEILSDALFIALWEAAREPARRLSLELRDFHYVDADHGLLPVPPGRHRAQEEGR